MTGGVIPECGHWLTAEKPDFIVKQLLDFFEESDAPASARKPKQSLGLTGRCRLGGRARRTGCRTAISSPFQGSTPVNVAIDFRNNAFVDGKWERAAGEAIDVINPATEEAIASLPSASEADVDHVLSAAQRAQRDWGRRPGGVRGEYVRGIAKVIRENADALAELISREVGKPLKAAHGELAFRRQLCRLHGRLGSADRRERSSSRTTPTRPFISMRVPVGVVAAITAWNFPIALFVRKVAPALVAGNAVVVKPTEIAPLSTLLLMRLIDQELGLPPGVLNVITGAGATGQALTRNARTNMVTFTGHRDTGKRVMADASANLTRVALELGGKAPAIVWRDADIAQAVEALAAARFGNSGQICTCAERALVHEFGVRRVRHTLLGRGVRVAPGRPNDGRRSWARLRAGASTTRLSPRSSARRRREPA